MSTVGSGDCVVHFTSAHFLALKLGEKMRNTTRGGPTFLVLSGKDMGPKTPVRGPVPFCGSFLTHSQSQWKIKRFRENSDDNDPSVMINWTRQNINWWDKNVLFWRVTDSPVSSSTGWYQTTVTERLGLEPIVSWLKVLWAFLNYWVSRIFFSFLNIQIVSSLHVWLLPLLMQICAS